MEIHIDKLKTTVLQLNHCIEEYEEIYMNFYHVVSSSSFFWNDNRSKKFYDAMHIEKNQVKTVIEELYRLKDIYDYIITEYEKIGTRLQIQLSEKKNVIPSFDKYLEQIQDCIQICTSISVETYPEVETLLIKEKSDFIKLQQQVQKTRDQLSQLFYKIEELESHVNKRINELQVQKISELEGEY